MILQQTEIENLINQCDGNIVITTHHKPDGDALGSSLGLWHFLNALGKKAVVITPTDFPNFLDWMPGRDEVIIYQDHVEQCNEIINAASIVFCLDFNALARINEMGVVVKNSKATLVMVDHHQEPEDFAHFQFHTVKTSSTCELIYDFITNSSHANLVNAQIATCLYVGIMTDTGGFKHSTTSSNTHRAAALLMDKGADHQQINQMVLDQNTLMKLKLIGYSVSRKLRLLQRGKVALLTLSKEELQKHHVQTGDTEGLVNYGLSIAGVELSVLIVDRTERVKMSFRSKNRFPCNTFAKENFEGGGHYHAAGGQSEDTLENTIAKFESKIEEHKEWL